MWNTPPSCSVPTARARGGRARRGGQRAARGRRCIQRDCSATRSGTDGGDARGRAPRGLRSARRARCGLARAGGASPGPRSRRGSPRRARRSAVFDALGRRLGELLSSRAMREMTCGEMFCLRARADAARPPPRPRAWRRRHSHLSFVVPAREGRDAVKSPASEQRRHGAGGLTKCAGTRCSPRSARGSSSFPCSSCPRSTGSCSATSRSRTASARGCATGRREAAVVGVPRVPRPRRGRVRPPAPTVAVHNARGTRSSSRAPRREAPLRLRRRRADPRSSRSCGRSSPFLIAALRGRGQPRRQEGLDVRKGVGRARGAGSGRQARK